MPMTGLAARLRFLLGPRLCFLLGAMAVAGAIAFAVPAQAQQAPIVDPQADVVNERTLLRELPRIQGDIDQLDPRARVLIQPAGRVWDHFHEVTLYWGGAIVILGTLARSEEHTSELQSRLVLVCRLLLEKKKFKANMLPPGRQ